MSFLLRHPEATAWGLENHRHPEASVAPLGQKYPRVQSVAPSGLDRRQEEAFVEILVVGREASLYPEASGLDTSAPVDTEDLASVWTVEI